MTTDSTASACPKPVERTPQGHSEQIVRPASKAGEASLLVGFDTLSKMAGIGGGDQIKGGAKPKSLGLK